MKRLLLITALTLLSFFGVIMGLRFLGLSQEFEKRKHPLVDEVFSLVAHRGGSLERPENTLASFDHASQLDPRIWLEFDLRLTRDNELVVIHDETVDRTTDGKGRVKDFTLEEIRNLDAGYKFQNEAGEYPYRGKGLRVPTFKEILEKYPGRYKVVEIKDEDETAVEKAVDLIQTHKQWERIILGSFHEKVIRSLRIKNPDWFYATSGNQMQRSLILRELGLLPVASFDGEFVMIPLRMARSPIDVYSRDLHDELRRQAREVFIWVINDEKSMRELLDKGVDGLITDKPSQLLEILRERGQ